MAFKNRATKRLTAQLRLAGGLEQVTLTSDITLTAKSANAQAIDPGGAARTITLPAEAPSDGLPFLLLNAADANEALTIDDDGGSTIVTLGKGEWAIVGCDGTDWFVLASDATGEDVGGDVGQTKMVTADIAYDDSSPSVLFTVPAGQVWLVHDVLERVGTAWDGSGADLDIGIQGGDTDGFIDGSAGPDLTTPGFYGADPSERGVLLFDDSVGDLDGESPILKHVIDATGGAVNVIATITPGSGAAAGTATAFLIYTRLV